MGSRRPRRRIFSRRLRRGIGELIGVVGRAMRWIWDVGGGEGTSDRENGRRDKKGVTRETSKIVGGSAYAVRDVGVGVVGIGIGDNLRVEECL